MISRRDFLTILSKLAVAAGCTGVCLLEPQWRKFLLESEAGWAYGASYLDELVKSAPKARYWTPLHVENIVKCQLCANGCAISEGQRGRCRT
ncbi:MAG TPA: hypothetical protein P5040_02880, partial [Smithella sp.]|nr:hypothetical protein [Smithella sp.]